MLDLTVSRSVDINAPVERVWNAMTDPAIIKEYLFGTNTQTDWKVGSPVTFSGEYQGQTYCDKGVVLENAANERLTYSYWSGFSGAEDIPENYSRISYGFAPRSHDVTTLTWTQTGFATEAGYEHSSNGLAGLLDQIKSIVERG